MGADTALVDSGKLDLTSLEVDNALSTPATKLQQKAHKVNNPNRMAAVECCTRTLVPSDAVKVGLTFLFIYSKAVFCSYAASI